MNNGADPIVSVVMPTYNRADLLPRTIASILGQGFGDFELLIVDDGSTDDTRQVIAEIQERDPRVRYLPLPENRGIGFARQAGLQHAPGMYVALADSDDLWLPSKLESQVGVLRRHPEIDILFADFWNVDYVHGTEASGFAETRTGMEHLSIRSLEENLWLVESGVEIGILRANFVAAPTMVLRADVFDRVGGFNIALSTPVDLEFGWRAAALGARYAYINRPLIERYRYKSSVTARTIDASLQKLSALGVCRQTCDQAGRADLRSHLRKAEQRTWRKLIWAYGRNRQRAAAVRAFVHSLRSGPSVRTAAFLATALLGPRVILLTTRIRAPL